MDLRHGSVENREQGNGIASNSFRLVLYPVAELDGHMKARAVPPRE
jgi:hypothetical protein